MGFGSQTQPVWDWNQCLTYMDPFSTTPNSWIKMEYVFQSVMSELPCQLSICTFSSHWAADPKAFLTQALVEGRHEDEGPTIPPAEDQRCQGRRAAGPFASEN